MARVLMIPMCWGRGIGPIHELLSLADALSARGAEVHFAARESFANLARLRGYGVAAVLPGPQTSFDVSYNADDFAIGQGMASAEYLERVLAAELVATRECRPDIVVSYLQPTTSTSSSVAGVRHAALARWTEHPNFDQDDAWSAERPPGWRRSGATDALNILRRANGQAEVGDFWDAVFGDADLRIAPGTPELEPGLALSDVNWVGYLEPIISEPPGDVRQEIRDWLVATGPRVYVYVSAGGVKLAEVMPQLCDIAADGAAVLVARGQHSDVRLDGWPSRVAVAEWVPGPFVVTRADVVVSLGTRTTAWQAMMAGCGQVFLPAVSDELVYIGQHLPSCGAGVAITDVRGLAAACRAADQPNVRESAGRIGQEMIRRGGPGRAADLLLELVA